MIDPEFWLDEELAKLSAYARLLFIGLWNICDDNYATFPAKIGWLKIQIFPYEEVDISKLLDELSTSTRILPFEDSGEKFFYIKNFFKYQRIDRPSAPKYPKYPGGLDEGSMRARPEVNEVKLSKLIKESDFKNSADQLRANIGTIIKKK